MKIPKFFRMYGKDEIKGRNADSESPGYPLFFFRGKPTIQMTKQDILNDEESLRKADKIKERDKIWSAVGITK